GSIGILSLFATPCRNRSCHDCDTVSTRSRQRRVPAPEARARILAATERLLMRDGLRYRDLTVDGVMAEAGLARTVFYRHFDGLPAVLLALLDEVAGQLAEAVDAGDDLRGVLEAVVAVYAEHGVLMRAVDEAAHVDDAVR